MAVHALPNIKNNSIEICSQQLIKYEINALLVLSTAVATEEAKDNESSPDKSYRNTFASLERGICFAIRPGEIGMQYFFWYMQLPGTSEFKGKGEKKKKK